MLPDRALPFGDSVVSVGEGFHLFPLKKDRGKSENLSTSADLPTAGARLALRARARPDQFSQTGSGTRRVGARNERDRVLGSPSSARGMFHS